MIVGRIIRTEESTDGRQNIRIIIEFSEDGTVIVPEWTLWAQYSNFIGLTAPEISEWIRLNVEHQIGNLIRERAKPVLNAAFMDAIEKMKATKIYQTDKVAIAVDANLVTPEAYTVTLNSDGTYTTDRQASDIIMPTAEEVIK